ncbi:alkaline phosphatase family protein [Peptostreptococcus canis]|uniref:Alkaline phosphatase family protein n=1 Tax=Peptostreptococcus canis TaxID=1159213 RepID=A0ABR6TM14_9FIRM|nr:alkaline phosphatase family protein [Peptostreptococcus canis]MBC2576183.1 alkaline phosphatase family protein [Peptostreptococcus canis]MBP1998282.1 putative AlkP superfamily pyrophosphatase or phosphodiesterase [Peptostreptococcus canis]
MSKKYLHILSFDGLSKVDIEKMKKFPTFSKFYENASGCINVKSVYPSLTYCAHASISTGVYPNNHGIINNTKMQMNRVSPDWHWYEKDIKVPTFQEVANKAGYSILSILWPVTAGSKNIKYNMPEVMANRKWQNQIMVSLISGSPLFQIEMNSKFGKLRNGISEPELDNFSHASFLYSISKYKPDINMVHYIDLDSQRHDYGFDSKEANDALKRLDGRLEDLIKKLKKEGIYEDSVIVVLGDHSSRDIHSKIYLNTLFNKEKLLSKCEDGTISSYKVVCKSSDGSAYIYADNEVSDDKILEIINPLVENNIIEKIYISQEAGEFGADSNCRFMLEAAEGYFFANPVREKVIMTSEESTKYNEKLYRNNHGFSPYTKKDYETVFLVSGKGIKKGVFIDDMNLVDEGPTFAAILGLDMKNVDGRVLEELLED